MNRSAVRLGIVAVLVLIFAGCLSLGPLGDDGQGVDTTAVTQQLTAVDSYRFELIQLRQSRTLNETTTLSGAIDRTEEIVSLNQTVATGTTSRRQSESRYVFDGNVEYANRDGNWEQITHDNPRWADFDYAREIAKTLQQAELERIGSETVAGTETTVFLVEPSSERINEIMGANRSGYPQRVVQDFDYYAYIDGETDTLYRMERRAVVTEGNQQLTISVRATFSKQTEPVTIAVPTAAQQGTIGD